MSLKDATLIRNVKNTDPYLLIGIFFLEFKSGAIKWNQELTKEHGNTFINTANTIVEIVSTKII